MESSPLPFQFHFPQYPLRHLQLFPVRFFRDRKRKHHILNDGEVRNQLERLKNETKILSSEIGEFLKMELIDRDLIHRPLPSCGVIETSQNGQKCGFSRT